ncbi:MAG: alanyl-tRNA editing protein, partial [Candidatus Zixiibacteriota bacterium]
MTERLYYTDADLTTFTATIVGSEQSGDKWHTVLDRSAFYPTSGGQLHDTGTLNGVAVVDVREDDRGDVVHVTETAVGAAGDKAEGRIDVKRRRRHRQAHTAQHLLSHAFVELCGLETVSVHLGEDYSAVELKEAKVTAEQCAAVQEYVNERIGESVPVAVMFVDTAEAERLPLRKKPTREGKLRIIRIGRLDWSACGGTHCNHTGEIRLLQIIGMEKLRGNTLVKFLCGDQALADYARRFTVTEALTRELTCGVDDLVAVVGKNQQNLKEIRRKLSALQLDLLPKYVEELSAKTVTGEKWPYVVENKVELDAALVNKLAIQTADRINGFAVLGVADRLV